MAAQFRVIVSGDLREGYETQAVIASIARQLKMPPQKVAQLINGKSHTVKTTSSLDEAKRYALVLSRNGAVTQIKKVTATMGDTEKTPAQKAPQVTGHKNTDKKSTTKTKKKAPPIKTEPAFNPLKIGWLFRPLSLLAATIDIAFVLFYAFFLIFLFVALLQQALFSSWLTDWITLPVIPTLLDLLILLVGTVILLITGKPLLSLLSVPAQSIPLLEQDEPDVYAFIEYLCEAINVPVPQSIHLTNDAEISMEYSSPSHLFKGTLELKMGLPLVAGLTTTQFAAAIIQATAPFGRKGGGRLQYIIHFVNGWLYRATYVDDLFDIKLKEYYAKQDEGFAKILAKFSGAARKLAGWYLEVQRHLTKRMVQYSIANTDRLACQVAGNVGFKGFIQQSRVLVFATKKITPSLREAWGKNGILPDNISYKIVTHSARYPKEIHEQFREIQKRQKIASQDIIPGDAQRFIRVDEEVSQGWCECGAAASSIFQHFDKLSHNMTIRYYHNYLNIPITSNKLIRTFAHGSAEYKDNQLIGDYFNRSYSDLIPLKIKVALSECENLNQESLLAYWRNAVQQIDATKIKISRAHLLLSYNKLIDAGTQDVLLRANTDKSIGAIIGLKSDDTESIAQSCRDAEHDYAQDEKSLGDELVNYRQRLVGSLALLQHPIIQNKMEDAAILHTEASSLFHVFERVEALYPQLHNLRLHSFYIEGLLSRGAGLYDKKQKWHDQVEVQESDIQQILTFIGIPLKAIPYPFQSTHSTQLKGYIEDDASQADTPLGAFDRGYDALNKLIRMQHRILGRLVQISLLIEKNIS